MTEERRGYVYEHGGVKASAYFDADCYAALVALANTNRKSFAWALNRAIKRGLSIPDPEMLEDQDGSSQH